MKILLLHRIRDRRSFRNGLSVAAFRFGTGIFWCLGIVPFSRRSGFFLWRVVDHFAHSGSASIARPLPPALRSFRARQVTFLATAIGFGRVPTGGTLLCRLRHLFGLISPFLLIGLLRQSGKPVADDRHLSFSPFDPPPEGGVSFPLGFGYHVT